MTDRVLNTIHDLRKRKGITQQEFADFVGVTRQTIIALEKGNYTPSVALAIRIAKYLKEPVEKIFTLDKYK